jgi:hypothetical protein
MRSMLTLFLSFVAVSLGGCYQLTVKNDSAAGSAPVERRAHQFAFGLYGETELDLKKECPHGVATFGDKFTAEDVLLSIASVGIYTPRTVVFECAAPARG